MSSHLSTRVTASVDGIHKLVLTRFYPTANITLSTSSVSIDMKASLASATLASTVAGLLAASSTLARPLVSRAPTDVDIVVLQFANLLERESHPLISGFDIVA